MAAPKGNLFALGNNGGRPPKYKTAKEIEVKISEYLDFEDSFKNRGAKGDGKGIYTIEGCALFLGFSNVRSMYDYRDRTEEFSHVLNRFKLFLTHWNAQKLYWGGTMAGAQFWLKNHGGYTDESTQNQNQKVTNVTVEVIPSENKINNSEKDIDI